MDRPAAIRPLSPLQPLEPLPPRHPVPPRQPLEPAHPGHGPTGRPGGAGHAPEGTPSQELARAVAAARAAAVRLAAAWVQTAAVAALGRLRRLPLDPWLCGFVGATLAGLVLLVVTVPVATGGFARWAPPVAPGMPAPAVVVAVAGAVDASLDAAARALLPPPPSCRVQQGFALLQAYVGPSVVGWCQEDERFDPASGTMQQRTTGGLFVWRQADNVLAFTDGGRTWVLGPFGYQRRLAGERFCWEADADPSCCDPARPDRLALPPGKAAAH